MDFITHCPQSQGFDAILVIVDRLMKHFLPYQALINAEGVAYLYIQYI
jgi:hypothetical protein